MTRKADKTPRVRLIHAILCVALLAFISTLLSCIGDRGPKVTYYNSTDTAIWLNVRGGIPNGFSGSYDLDPRIANRGPIEPGESRSFAYFDIPLSRDLGERLGNWGITAITSDGTIVYQRIFTWTELHDMGWRVVISPTARGMEQSDNVTGK